MGETIFIKKLSRVGLINPIGLIPMFDFTSLTGVQLIIFCLSLFHKTYFSRSEMNSGVTKPRAWP